MRFDSDLDEPRTNAEQSETGDDFRVSYESESCVYFIAADNGLVKIGFCADFLGRLSRLQNGSPVPLYPLVAVRGGRVEERAFHERFKRWRRHGEWFELTEEMEDLIDEFGREQNARYRPHRFRHLALPLTLTRTL